MFKHFGVELFNVLIKNESENHCCFTMMISNNAYTAVSMNANIRTKRMDYNVLKSEFEVFNEGDPLDLPK